MRQFHYFLLVGGVVLDQITKYLSVKYLSFFTPVSILPPFLNFQLVYNKGAAYGIFEDKRLFLLGVSLFVLILTVGCKKFIIASEWSRLGLIFLWMGTIGNFIDRLVLGYVIDFINIGIIPVFNIADIAINCAVGCFILEVFLVNEKSKA